MSPVHRKPQQVYYFLKYTTCIFQLFLNTFFYQLLIFFTGFYLLFKKQQSCHLKKPQKKKGIMGNILQ